MAGGMIQEMIRMVDQFPPEARCKIPKQRTLYNLQKEKDWKNKYLELTKAIRGRMEDQNGLTYDRLNKAASSVLGLFMLKLAGIAGDYGGLDNQKSSSKIPVKASDLKMLWEIMRTERGLPQNITKTSIEDSREDGIDSVIEKEAGQEFLDMVDKLDEDTVANLLSGLKVDDEPPSFIE